MQITWLVQDVYIKLYEIYNTFDALTEMNATLMSFGIMQKSKEITNLENILIPDTKFVLRSTTKVATLVREATHISELNDFLSEEQLDNSDYYLNRLRDGMFYDIEKFDQYYYNNLDVELPLLNGDAIYVKIKHNLNTTFNHDYFIKPSQDRKAFNGGILKAGTTIAQLKNISYEYRMFVVDNVVVAGSQYVKDGVVVTDAHVPQEIYTFTEECHKLYQPDNVYCIDIAATDDGLKIVEYNGWNFSGAYQCDLVKTYTAIEKYLNK